MQNILSPIFKENLLTKSGLWQKSSNINKYIGNKIKIFEILFRIRKIFNKINLENDEFGKIKYQTAALEG